MIDCDKWSNFWFGDDSTYYNYASYNIGVFFFSTYIPMVMQISSLIFGFMRHKKVKLFRQVGDRDRTKSDTSNRLYQTDGDEDSIEDGVTSHSMSTNTHNSDNSWFDPPIENYRFYYQGTVNEMTNSKNQQPSGFFLKPRRTAKLGGNSETQS